MFLSYIPGRESQRLRTKTLKALQNEEQKKEEEEQKEERRKRKEKRKTSPQVANFAPFTGTPPPPPPPPHQSLSVARWIYDGVEETWGRTLPWAFEWPGNLGGATKDAEGGEEEDKGAEKGEEEDKGAEKGEDAEEEEEGKEEEKSDVIYLQYIIKQIFYSFSNGFKVKLKSDICFICILNKLLSIYYSLNMFNTGFGLVFVRYCSHIIFTLNLFSCNASQFSVLGAKLLKFSISRHKKKYFRLNLDCLDQVAFYLLPLNHRMKKKYTPFIYI